MTSKPPAQEALEDYKVRKASGFNLEGMGAWVWQNEKEIIRSLNILKAIESEEWKCVLVEPVEDTLISAAYNSQWTGGRSDEMFRSVWKEMINAAPEIGEEK